MLKGDMPENYTDTAFTNGYEFTQGSGYTLPEYPFVEPPELRSGEVKRYPSSSLAAASPV